MRIPVAVSLFVSSVLSAGAAVIMDYDDGIPGNGVHEGDLNGGGFDDTAIAGDAATFADHTGWFGYNAAQTDQASRTNIAANGAKTDGSVRSAVLTATRVFGIALDDGGYTVAAGDVYNLSFVWRDAANWVDASGQVTIQLAYYANEGAGGFDPVTDPYTSFASFAAPVSTADGTWESAGITSWGPAPAEAAGKTLYMIMSASSGFGRADNFTLEAIAVPEPGGGVLVAAGALALLRRGRRRRA